MMFLSILGLSIICLIGCNNPRVIMNHWIHWIYPDYEPYREEEDENN
jgi:hypothetical protein